MLRRTQKFHCDVQLREQIFGRLEKDVFQQPDQDDSRDSGGGWNPHLGRPGMTLWSAIVLALVKPARHCDFDRLAGLAGRQESLRRMSASDNNGVRLARIVALTVLAAALVASAPGDLESVAALDFGLQVAPVLESRCYACHGSSQQMSGLRLDSEEAALKGGHSGPVILPDASKVQEPSWRVHAGEGLSRGTEASRRSCGGATYFKPG